VFAVVTNENRPPTIAQDERGGDGLTDSTSVKLPRQKGRATMAESEPKRPRTLAELCDDGTDGGCPKCGCKDFRRMGQTDKEICRNCGRHVRTIAAK